MTIKNAVYLSVLCLLYSVLWGCAAPFAVQGLSATSPVAFSHIGRGKSDSFWLARYEDVIQATERAGRALSLTLEKKKIEKDHTTFNYADGKGSQMEVLIERRTATMTYARFDVGLLGSRSMGRLMARQIVFEMTEADAFLRDWQAKEVD